MSLILFKGIKTKPTKRNPEPLTFADTARRAWPKTKKIRIFAEIQDFEVTNGTFRLKKRFRKL